VNDLLWYTDSTSPRRSKDHQVPTWSWASVDSMIKHLPTLSLFGNFVTIVDAQTTVTSDHPGTDNYIMLNGYLLPIPAGNYTTNANLPDCRDDTTEAHHFCLPLRLQRLDQHYHLCGLVLRSVEEAFTPTYERIGMFRFVHGDEVHIASHQNLGHACVFSKNPGDVVDIMSLSKSIIIT
jgi:hypothetical protein